MATKKKAKAKKAKARADEFLLVIEYPGMPDGKLERELVELVSRARGGKRLGSGYNFFDDVRDMEFGFARRQSAVAAARCVRKRYTPARLRVRVEGRIWP